MGQGTSRRVESVESQLALQVALRDRLMAAFMNRELRDETLISSLASKITLAEQQIACLKREYERKLESEGRICIDEIAMMSAKRQELTLDEHKRRLESIGLKPEEAIRKVEETSVHLKQLRVGAATVNRHAMGLAGNREVEDAEEAVLEAEEERLRMEEVQQVKARAVPSERSAATVTISDLLAMRAAIHSGRGAGSPLGGDSAQSRELRKQPAA